MSHGIDVKVLYDRQPVLHIHTLEQVEAAVEEFERRMKSGKMLTGCREEWPNSLYWDDEYEVWRHNWRCEGHELSLADVLPLAFHVDDFAQAIDDICWFDICPLLDRHLIARRQLAGAPVDDPARKE